MKNLILTTYMFNEKDGVTTTFKDIKKIKIDNNRILKITFGKERRTIEYFAINLILDFEEVGN